MHMMSKRLLITVAESTKVITIDGSVDVNGLKEVSYSILGLNLIINFLLLVLLIPCLTGRGENWPV